MSDTPRTDAVNQRNASLPPAECLAEMDALARQLEREFDEMRGLADGLATQLLKAEKRLKAREASYRLLVDAHAKRLLTMQRQERCLRLMIGDAEYERLMTVAERS